MPKQTEMCYSVLWPFLIFRSKFCEHTHQHPHSHLHSSHSRQISSPLGIIPQLVQVMGSVKFMRIRGNPRSMNLSASTHCPLNWILCFGSSSGIQNPVSRPNSRLQDLGTGDGGRITSKSKAKVFSKRQFSVIPFVCLPVLLFAVVVAGVPVWNFKYGVCFVWKRKRVSVSLFVCCWWRSLRPACERRRQ